MIKWIKTHKLLSAALAAGAIVLYWLYKKGYFSSSQSTAVTGTAPDPLASYYASLGTTSGGVGGGTSSATGTTQLQDFTQALSPADVANQPGTSGSGVPSFVAGPSSTQPVSPVSLPPSGPSFNPPANTPTGSSPTVALPCNPNDANCFTTNAFIKASNQNVDARQANQGLAPGFTQEQFNADWAASNNGANAGVLNSLLGTKDVLSQPEVYADEYARAGFVRNAAGTYDAINAGASITGFDASGNPIVDWGSYTGPGSPNYKAPTTTPPPPAPTVDNRPPAPTFTGAGRTPGGGSPVTRGYVPPTTPPPPAPSAMPPNRMNTNPLPVPVGRRRTLPVDISTMPVPAQIM